MADVFSIITTLQALEKAYIKDVIEPAAQIKHFLFILLFENNVLNRYTKHCETLLAKFAAAFRQIESEFPRIEDFQRKYKVE